MATPKTHSDGGAPAFANDRILDAAFTHFRQTGFPYRHVPIHVAMQRLNQLAATTPSALLSTTVTTFREAGMLTANHGLVVRLADDSEFQVTIIQSQGSQS